MSDNREIGAAVASMSPWRPTKAETFLELAKVWRTRSTCPRGQVGCVIVTLDGFVLTSGYNGAPRGLAHCTSVGCLMDGNHCVRAIHAEMNAIIQASREGVSLIDSLVYTTKRPCIRCTVALIQAGVKHITFLEDYHSDDTEEALALLAIAGVTWRKHPNG